MKHKQEILKWVIGNGFIKGQENMDHFRLLLNNAIDEAVNNSSHVTVVNNDNDGSIFSHWKDGEENNFDNGNMRHFRD